MTADDLVVSMRCYGLPTSEDTDEPLVHVFENAPRLFKLPFACKSTPSALAAKAKTGLDLS